jgi:hypothetical protein
VVAGIDPTATVQNPISASWGASPTAPESIDGNQWLLIAEGTYGSDGLPSISPDGTSVTVYNSDYSSRLSDVCIGWPCTPVPAPNRVPPPVDPQPEPVVTLPVVPPVYPVPPEVAPPVPDVPPHILPIEIIDIPTIEDPPIVIPPIVDLPNENPPIEGPPQHDPPAYDPPIAELPQVDPVPRPVTLPGWLPPYEIISLPFIMPERALTEGGYVLQWGEELLVAEPWIGGAIDLDIGTLIDATDFRLFTTNVDGDMPYQAVLLGATNDAGRFTRLAYDSNGEVFMVSASLDSRVPEPTSAVLAALAMLTSSLALRRRGR